MVDPLDVIMIHQLLGRYGHAVDQRDWDRFAGLFVAEATIDYQGGTATVIREGRDAVVEWFRSVAGQHPPAHHVTNIVVDDSADADGSVPVHSKFIAPFTRDQHSPKRLYGGDYHDVVVRTADGWKFAHKQCIPRWNMTVVSDHDAPEHRRTF